MDKARGTRGESGVQSLESTVNIDYLLGDRNAYVLIQWFVQIYLNLRANFRVIFVLHSPVVVRHIKHMYGNICKVLNIK